MVAKGLVVMESHQRPGPVSADVVALDSNESRRYVCHVKHVVNLSLWF